jgi:hypothetical protein
MDGVLSGIDADRLDVGARKLPALAGAPVGVDQLQFFPGWCFRHRALLLNLPLNQNMLDIVYVQASSGAYNYKPVN